MRSDLGWFENSIDVDRMMLMQAGWCNDYANPKLDDIVKEIRDECSAIENNAAMMIEAMVPSVAHLPAFDVDELSDLMNEHPSPAKRRKLFDEHCHVCKSGEEAGKFIAIPPSIIMAPPPCPDPRPAADKYLPCGDLRDLPRIEEPLSLGLGRVLQAAELHLPQPDELSPISIYQICDSLEVCESPEIIEHHRSLSINSRKSSDASLNDFESSEEIEVIDLVNADPIAQNSLIELIYNPLREQSGSPGGQSQSSQGNARGKRPPGMSLAGLSEEMIAERKRQQNRAAAARYRRKQRDGRIAERDEIEYLEQRNAQLRRDADKLEAEIARLKQDIFAGVAARRASN